MIPAASDTLRPRRDMVGARRSAMQITICDVGPRDGLQNDPKVLDPEVRAELVNRLAAAGLPRVETVSFVNPARVPQMAGAEEVVAAIGPAAGALHGRLAVTG